MRRPVTALATEDPPRQASEAPVPPKPVPDFGTLNFAAILTSVELEEARQRWKGR